MSHAEYKINNKISRFVCLKIFNNDSNVLRFKKFNSRIPPMLDFITFNDANTVEEGE